jgi:hypothetical protein
LLFQGFRLFHGIAVDADAFAVPVLDVDERGVVEAENRFLPFHAAMISPPVRPADFIGEVFEEDIHRGFINGKAKAKQRTISKC